jgi:hypothetical protein
LVTETAEYQVGDQVQLVSVPPGRSPLKAGEQGTVVVGSEAALAFGCVSVEFARPTRRVWLLHPRHLRLIERPMPAAEVPA